MKALEIRCRTCGSRTNVQLTFTEEQDVEARKELRRFCRQCFATTLWDILQPDQTSGVFQWRGAEPERETEPEKEKGMGRVLLIDDDESFLSLLRQAFSQQPVELETASSARQAAAQLVRRDYDVILVDIRIPEFDGKQLFQFLEKHLPEYKQRVIFLTGDFANPDTMRFLQEAKRPYLTKPIDIPALLELVRKFLPQS